jgi:hypothetical protein
VGVISPWVKRPEPEVDHSSASILEAKNDGDIALLSNILSRSSAYIIRPGTNLLITLYFHHHHDKNVHAAKSAVRIQILFILLVVVTYM